MTEIPVSDKYCIRICNDGKIFITYIGFDPETAHGVSFIVPTDNIQPMIDALVRAQKLMVLK